MWQRNASKDQVRSLFCEHNHRTVEVSTDDAWHDRCIYDSQTFHPHNAAHWIDHHHVVFFRRAHSACTWGVIGCLGCAADEGVDVGVRLHVFSRQNFFAAEFIKCTLREHLHTTHIDQSIKQSNQPTSALSLLHGTQHYLVSLAYWHWVTFVYRYIKLPGRWPFNKFQPPKLSPTFSAKTPAANSFCIFSFNCGEMTTIFQYHDVYTTSKIKPH